MTSCPTCQYANPGGARYCNQCGSALDVPRPVEGERKFVTVAFVDVVRSTALAEQLGAEDWAAVMNGAFGFMNAAIDRYGGTVSRLMGDGLLAIFGAPAAHDDDAERAVRAGLELVDAAADYSRMLHDRHGLDFGVRVGINTGTSVLAHMGDSVRTEYTSMGDTANIAARLQAEAEPGTVLISADTHRLVRGVFEVERRGALTLKGKSAPVEAYRVTGIRTEPGPARGLEGVHSRLVGRDAELRLLRERIAGLAAGRGGVVAVTGEAGLGKSRLLAELRDEVTASDVVRWYEGRAISYGQALAYHPWQHAGRSLIGASPADGPAAARERLRAYAARLALPPEDLPFLEAVAGVDAEEGGSPGGLDGAELIQRIGDAVVGVLRAAIREGGGTTAHVLVFDDLHWADHASLELLAHVATVAAAEPLLLVCLLRPEKAAPSWATLERIHAAIGDAFTRIELQALDGEQARELLGNLLHVEDLPDTVRQIILRRSDGNPFFLEEILRSLVDSGHVRRDNGRWRATGDISEVRIPETLAGVLSARIDRLPDTAKRVAQTAAVLGRTFSYRPLQSVCRAAPPAERVDDLDPHLGTLTEEELVRERAREPEREFSFKHALTQEAAYGLLLRQRRQELHRRAGEALESLYPDRLGELAPVLARHFREGDDAVRAARYAVKAGQRALRIYATLEALDHFEQACAALEGMDDPPAVELCDAILGWSYVRYKLARYDGVLDRLRGAEAVARAADDTPRLARILSWIATFHMLTGFPSRAAEPLKESQALATGLDDIQAVLLPIFFSTEFLMDDDPRKAVEQLGEVVEMARRENVPDILGHALAARAQAHARLGEFEQAREYIRQALEVAPSGGHKVKEADVHIIVGGTYLDMGEVEKGLEHARIGAELAHSMNAIECACAGYFGVGMARLERKELDDAVRQFSRSLQLADYAGWEGFVNRIRAGKASAEILAGEPRSIAELEQALRNARSGNDRYATSLFALMLADAYRADGDAGRARKLVDAAIQDYRDRGMRPYLARALDVSARVAELEQDAARAAADRHEADAIRSALHPVPASSE